MRGTLGKAHKIHFPPDIWMWIVDLSIPYQKQSCRIFLSQSLFYLTISRICSLYSIVLSFTISIQGSLKLYTILPQSYIGLTNITQILPYQIQKAVEEDCGTFCGPPETVLVQRSDALKYLRPERPKTFYWETFFVEIYYIFDMYGTHLCWKDGERANARKKGWS